MKKLYTMLAMMLMALAFASCETDEDIAYTLEGTWKGNMHINSEWDGRYYNTTYSEITFLKDPYSYSSGTGYWVDYYSGAPWDYVANHIEWTVKYGDIEIYFVEEGTTMIIRNYHLYRGRFTGTIYDSGNVVDFDLYQTTHPNYNSYRWGYSAWGYDPYYSRSMNKADGKTTAPAAPRRFVNPEAK
jgi:hypothetical protein